MKKQIFILVLALSFIGITKSFGQLIPHTINCLPHDALHPISGQAYTYQIDVPITPTNGDAWVDGSLKYTWFVTQLNLNGTTPDNLFINNGILRSSSDAGDGTGNFIALASAGDYATPNTADNILNLTWKNVVYDATKPLFVVISVVGDNGVCLPQNMKVFKIEPIIAFTVDIDNLTNLGASHTLPEDGGATADYGDLYEQCISNITSASFDATTGRIIYDYDKNYLLYEVVAANWTNSWNLGVKLKGIDPLETITVEWSKDKTFASGVQTMTGPSNSASAASILTYTNAIPAGNVTANASNGNVGAAGESIFIRVTLDHSVSAKPNFEGLIDQNIEIAVHGMTKWDATLTTPAFTVNDVRWDNSGTAPTCSPLVADNYDSNKAFQDVKARPTITNTTANPMPAPGLILMRTPNP